LDFIWDFVTLINQSCTVISSLCLFIALPQNPPSIHLTQLKSSQSASPGYPCIHMLSEFPVCVPPRDFPPEPEVLMTHRLKWFFPVCGQTSPTFPSYDMDHTENDMSINSVVARIHCSGSMFTEPLASNGMKNTHTDTQTVGRDLLSTPVRWVQALWYTY
jgi:hypothetical protein